MAFRLNGIARTIATAALLLPLAGCVGIYNNSNRFMSDPATNMDEVTLIQQYGTPAFATTVEDKKVYTWKVRDTKYIIFIGVYEGYDLVVTTRDGVVVEAKRVARPDAFALFQPLPWAVTD